MTLAHTKKMGAWTTGLMLILLVDNALAASSINLTQGVTEVSRIALRSPHVGLLDQRGHWHRRVCRHVLLHV